MNTIFKKTCLFVGIRPEGVGTQVNARCPYEGYEVAQSEVLELKQNIEILNVRYPRDLG